MNRIYDLYHSNQGIRTSHFGNSVTQADIRSKHEPREERGPENSIF